MSRLISVFILVGALMLGVWEYQSQQANTEAMRVLDPGYGEPEPEKVELIVTVKN